MFTKSTKTFSPSENFGNIIDGPMGEMVENINHIDSDEV